MSSILSVILAIMMALTGMCGNVAKEGKPVTLEAGVVMDGDLSVLMAGSGMEESGAVVDAIKSLLNALTIRFSADASTAQMEVLLNGAPAASLAGKAQDGEWSFISNLFPSTMLTVKDETLQQFASMAGPALDPEAIAEAVKAPLEELAAYFEGAKGEPETGSWNVGGVDYTAKVTYNVTTKEALEKILTAVQTILNDERISGIVSMMGDQFSPAQIEETLAGIKDQDEAEMPVLSAAEYANEAGDTCTEILLAQDEQSISMLIATAGQVTKVDIDMLGQLTVALVIDQENQQFDLNASFAYEGVAMNIVGSLKVADDRSDFSFSATIPAGETAITLGIKGAATHDAPVFEAADGLNVVALETMMTDEEAATAFSNEFQMGTFALVGNIMQQFPELAMLMNTGTGVQEAPAE